MLSGKTKFAFDSIVSATFTKKERELYVKKVVTFIEKITLKMTDSYMFVCMILQTINPTISNSIAKLFFLSIQNVLNSPEDEEFFVRTYKV